METQDNKELIKYLKIIAEQNKTKRLIFRGCVTGMFSSLGTLAGLAIIVFVGINLLGSLRQLEIIDSILEYTKLDVLIENQVSKLTSSGDQATGSAEQDNTQRPTDTIPELLTYNDTAVGLEFKYPATFTNISTQSGSTADESLVVFGSSTGALHALEVFVNQQPTVVGNSSQRFVQGNAGRIRLDVFEQGALINGEQYSFAVYTASISGSNLVTFVGYADSELPKTAREVFSSIISSANVQ